MEITEVRVRLVASDNDKLRAFCSITIDHDFVVRDLRIIEGPKGPFVAMPSRKLTQKCSRCGAKNPYRANYCNECGRRMPPAREAAGALDRAKLHADIAHPINSRCREVIQRQVLEEYAAELERAKAPGYRPVELDAFDEEPFEAAGTEGIDAAARPEAAGVPAAGPERARERPSGKRRRRRHGPRDGGQRPRQGEREGGRAERSGGGRVWRGPDSDRREPAVSSPPAAAPAAAFEADDADYFARDRLRGQPPPETRRLPVEPDVEPEDNFGAGIFS